MNHERRRLLVVALAGSAGLLAMAACSKQTDTTIVPAEIDAATSCDLDGMLLGDYPGPKAQLYYTGDARPHFGDARRRDAARQLAHHGARLGLDGDDADIRIGGLSSGNRRGGFIASAEQRRTGREHHCNACRSRTKS